MSKVTEKIKQELLLRCEKSKEKDGNESVYNRWKRICEKKIGKGL